MQPRAHHYRFVHQWLAGEALRNPAQLFTALKSSGAGALYPLWEAAGSDLPHHDRLAPQGLDARYIGQPTTLEAVIVTLPSPIAPTEGFAAAIARRAGEPVRYFVMERGFDGEGGQPRAYVAEWRLTSSNGVMRVRGGDLPALSFDAFATAVAAELSQPAAVRAPPSSIPPAPARSVPPPAKKKKGKGLLFAGCGGCLTLLVAMCGAGGYLVYLEEGVPYNEPGDEVVSAPIAAGQPFELPFTWDGTGYASHTLWLDVSGRETPGSIFNVSGVASCSQSPSLGTGDRPLSIGLDGFDVARLERHPDGTFNAWLRLADDYSHSTPAPVVCRGTVQPLSGEITRARAVVTQRQRPSDWASF